MYEEFFDLRERPFTPAPNTQRYFPAEGAQAARTTLTRIVERAEGVGLIMGPSGTGKTLLCQMLADDFKDRLAVALLTGGRVCTRRALLQAILYEMRLPYRGMEEGDLRLSLIDHLTPERGGHPGLLLLVDEAHTLPWRLLEELRMITNLVRDGQSRVRLVLSGNSHLEERFANPKLESFSQRVAARCYLGSLGCEETQSYVRHQVFSAGGEPDLVFEPEAYETIYRAVDGIPRMINQVCDHALILAGMAECRPITAALIEEAWSDLQQLPLPRSASDNAMPTAGSVVEFAAFDDSVEDVPSAIPMRSVETSETSSSLTELHNERRAPQIEKDFEPAGLISPEIELVFGNAINPFKEVFEQEEVVIDRYASLESSLFAQRPVVSSREGQELSKLLAPWTSKPPEPTLPLKPPITQQPAAGSREVVRPFGLPSIAVNPHITSPAATIGSQNPVIGQNTTKPPPALTDDDTDLIVVENDEPNPPPKSPAVRLVRRQEYRQLFAKMRRG